MSRNTGIGRLVVFILLGMILGGIFGEVLGVVLGQIGVISGGGIDNPIRNFFVYAFEPSLGMQGEPILLNLYMIQIKFGIGFKFNMSSVAGLIASLYIMKWSK